MYRYNWGSFVGEKESLYDGTFVLCATGLVNLTPGGCAKINKEEFNIAAL